MPIKKINGTYVSYKTSKYNYHDIMRKNGNLTFKCGSSKDFNKNYPPINNTMCLINELQFTPKNNSNMTLMLSNFNRDWLFKLNRNNDYNNPISRIYYSISQPCINTNIKYMDRETPINPMFKDYNENCEPYSMKYHTSYIESGFSEIELNAY